MPARRRSPSSRGVVADVRRGRTSSEQRCGSMRACGTCTSSRASALPTLRELTPRVIAQFRADLEPTASASRRSARRWRCSRASCSALSSGSDCGRTRSDAVRKPPKQRQRAIVPFPPARIEGCAPRCSRDGRLRDATLISVLAYAGLRPQEALALAWATRPRADAAHRAGGRRWRAEGSEDRQAASHGHLLGPLKQDLAEWRLQQGRPPTTEFVFPASDGNPWRDHDWRNWRRRAFAEAARACGIESAPPVRPAPFVRVAADPRAPAVDRRDRAAARAQPERLPLDLRARHGRAAMTTAACSAEEQIRSAARHATWPKCGPGDGAGGPAVARRCSISRASPLSDSNR